MTLPFPEAAQPRKSRKEPGAVYAAVLKLRELGYRVYRAGRDVHQVNGTRLTDAALKALATEEADLPDDYFEGGYWD